jgi:hypothetical protein
MWNHKAEVTAQVIKALISLPQMHILLMVLHQEWNSHGTEDPEYSTCHNWSQDEHVQDICI